MLNTGDGTFRPQVLYAATSGPSALAVADFNGDGFVDVAVANDWPGDVASVLLNRGDGTLATPVTYTAGSFSPVSTIAFVK